MFFFFVPGTSRQGWGHVRRRAQRAGSRQRVQGTDARRQAIGGLYGHTAKVRYMIGDDVLLVGHASPKCASHVSQWTTVNNDGFYVFL